MVKISALPPAAAGDPADELPGVDDSASTTKKYSFNTLKEWFQSLTGWITHAMVSDGFCVQQASATLGTVTTTTSILPVDNTVPQITEGTQILSVTITPKSATDVFIIEAGSILSPSSAGNPGMAIFKVGTSNALAAVFSQNGTDRPNNESCRVSVVAGTTSPITFTVRVGLQLAGTLTVNGISGTQYYGGVMASTLIVREYKAS